MDVKDAREALDTLSEQEKALHYLDGFDAWEALSLGRRIAELSRGYGRGITVEIVRESDDMRLFCWSADDKAPRNYGFTAGKRSAARECGHASVLPQLKAVVAGDAEKAFDRVPEVIPAAGAFPIRVGANGELAATVSVSGLHDGLDHELVVKALESELGVSVPSIRCVLR